MYLNVYHTEDLTGLNIPYRIMKCILIQIYGTLLIILKVITEDVAVVSKTYQSLFRPDTYVGVFGQTKCLMGVMAGV